MTLLVQTSSQYQATPTKNFTKETKCLQHFIQQHQGKITPEKNIELIDYQLHVN